MLPLMIKQIATSKKFFIAKKIKSPRTFIFSGEFVVRILLQNKIILAGKS